jgi:hypothetical protein
MQIDEFSTDWWQWWKILQPEWRGDGLDFLHDILEDMSWAEIRKGGPNGFFIINCVVGCSCAGPEFQNPGRLV